MLSGVIDAVVFDFGGVFLASPFEAIRRMADERGLGPELTLALLFGSYAEDTDHPWHRCERGELDLMTARDEIRRLSQEQGLDLDLFEIMKYMGGDRTVRETMVECVRRVRAKGLRTAILTNNIVEGRTFWRPLIPLDELFDVVVDSSEIGMRKPNLAIYRHTLDLLGVEASRAAFLDDYDGNVRAAEQLGMIGILVGDDPAAAIQQVDELLTRVA